MSIVADDVWFNGPVAEAVSLVNSRDCMFVAYIFDDTANSQRLDQTLSNDEVMQALSSKTVAVKMHVDSDNANLFKQLYPTYHVPVVYFIRHGTIKDFGVEDITAEQILSKIEQVQETHQQQASPAAPVTPAPPPTGTRTVAEQPAPSSDTHPVSHQQQLPHTGPSTDEEANAAKKERLRQQMENARKKREEEEKQRAKENELKRRQDGKSIQHAREESEERQNKRYFDKIKKEKREDEEHRRRIKEQIARDRAEQAAARHVEKQHKPTRSISESSASGVKRARNSSQLDHSSISIRQLDGSTMRSRFNASDTLSVVKDWIDQNRTDGDQPYKLLAQFPTRQFSIGDEDRTLRELELHPSATLIMKGIKNVSNAYGAGESYGVMGYVYSAGGLLYNAASSVSSAVSGAVYSVISPGDQGTSPGATTPPSAGSLGASAAQQPPSPYSSSPGQRLGGRSTTRPRSNINTLRDTIAEDDDSDHRTYNGNSLNQE